MTPSPQWICRQCNDHCVAGCQFPVARKPDGCLYTMNGKPLENAVWQPYEDPRPSAAPTCIEDITPEGAAIIQAAKKEAVAATLDKLVAWRKEKELKGECPEDCIKDWLEEDIFILSLRSTPSAPQEERR